MKSRHIRLAENGNLPRNNAPRLSTASPGMTSTARGACRASSDSCLHPGSLCAAGAPGGSWRAAWALPKPGRTSWLPRRRAAGFWTVAAPRRPGGETTLATVHAHAPHLDPSRERVTRPARSHLRYPADLAELDCLALLRDRGFTFRFRLSAGLRDRVTPVQRGRWKELRITRGIDAEPSVAPTSG